MDKLPTTQSTVRIKYFSRNELARKIDLTAREETSMSVQEWDALEFVQRFKNGEFDGQWSETFDSLSPDQIEDLHSLLLMQGESRHQPCQTV